ncbi:MAG: hypothetical protein JOZ19_00705, partial [Rubrobacter sp.]|nr:hypothetical protein [Rubrobacter sp.]
MDEHMLTRSIGWVSIGVGLTLVMAPKLIARAFGIGERPTLGRSSAYVTSSSAPVSCPGEEIWSPGRELGQSPTPEMQRFSSLGPSLASSRRRSMFAFAVASILSAFGFTLARRL